MMELDPPAIPSVSEQDARTISQLPALNVFVKYPDLEFPTRLQDEFLGVCCFMGAGRKEMVLKDSSCRRLRCLPEDRQNDIRKQLPNTASVSLRFSGTILRITNCQLYTL
jgi:hypothetical protein